MGLDDSSFTPNPECQQSLTPEEREIVKWLLIILAALAFGFLVIYLTHAPKPSTPPPPATQTAGTQTHILAQR